MATEECLKAAESPKRGTWLAPLATTASTQEDKRHFTDTLAPARRITDPHPKRLRQCRGVTLYAKYNFTEGVACCCTVSLGRLGSHSPPYFLCPPLYNPLFLSSCETSSAACNTTVCSLRSQRQQVLHAPWTLLRIFRRRAVQNFTWVQGETDNEPHEEVQQCSDRSRYESQQLTECQQSRRTTKRRTASEVVRAKHSPPPSRRRGQGRWVMVTHGCLAPPTRRKRLQPSPQTSLKHRQNSVRD